MTAAATPAPTAGAKAAKAVSPEGFSVNPETGKPPAGGFMVAQTGHTHTYPQEIMGDREGLAKAIDRMLVEEGVKGGSYLGGWVHDGKLWLEPSDNIADRDQAVKLAGKQNQIAIWDVEHGQEIPTGGSGGGVVKEHDLQGNLTRTFQA